MNTFVDLYGHLAVVAGTIHTERFGDVPLLNIRQMSDEEWTRRARESFLRKYEQEHGKQAEFPEEAYRTYCDDIRRKAKGLPERNIPVVYC